MERFFDLFFSTLALLMLAPFLILISLFLRITGEGEVLFLQKRIGKDGEVFDLYKFATMLKDSPNIGTGTITMKNDPRILPFGTFLRRTKINELPQLLNIFFGHMSVIGPRPLTPQTFASYSKDTQQIISKVRPGLSGVGSVIFRGEEELMHGKAASFNFYQSTIAPYKGALEEWFVVNKDLRLYFICIAITIWIVIKPSSNLPWKVFKSLPVPPDILKKALNFPM